MVKMRLSMRKRLRLMLNLPRYLKLIWRLLQDDRVKLAYKLLLIGGSITYFLLPVDFIPDFLPFLGELDDLSVLFFLFDTFIKNCPPEVVQEHLQK